MRLCAERNLSINKLATICGLPPSSVKNILYGRSADPKILTIKKICDGLDITLAEFFSTPEFDALEQEIK
ncbi:MAG: helix-turn-helix transcriptional regulator [Oscillibacter sp.]|nr:helix-turn-helix transcriptional regulator [Oscillibacter sp.]